jgi:hypothetical protein
MAIYGQGPDYDITCHADNNLRTTTSQYWVVGMVAGTTTATRWVQATGDTGTYGEPTAASNHAIGINQTYMSSGSTCLATVRLFGVSKAICADSITAGDFVRAYQGISTTSRIGMIVRMPDRVTCSAATQSITSHTVVLGRALESGQTNSVISVFLNPHLYDNNLVASTT